MLDYLAYIGSPQWRERRYQWAWDWRLAHPGQRPRCVGCGQPWSLATGELHHVDYQRLGAEQDRDLVPLCRDCHRQVHYLLEHGRGWRRMTLQAASRALLVKIQRQNGMRDPA